MSESMSNPWIRDYLIDVAETHGSQIYNAPVSKGKKRVQLTHFLTYHPDSYVWACISDKDVTVSVRISKEAVDTYKNYRPMFAPRPLGPNAPGRTPISHISLEVDHISSIGIGAHLFGDPRDLESDQNIKEWVLGLREDGGGGNVLKLRKQQKLAQNTKEPSPPLPPLVSDASVSHHQTTKVAEDVAKPKPERPQDFKRAYAKRWRVIEVNLWKFATKPIAEEKSAQTNLSHPPDEPPPDIAGQSQLRQHAPSDCPMSPRRTLSRASLQRQGTPTDWSPSNRGSPSPRSIDEAGTFTLPQGIQQHCDDPVVSPTVPLSSDAKEPIAPDTTSDTHSLRPPTPAQRIKRSSSPYSPSPPRSSPEPITCPSQLLSSPLPPSSSLPLPPSSFPLLMGIRKNFQRKVPHPGLPVSRPDPTKQGPVQILVPNSDTSGIGSSQSQSQPFSQSQQQLQFPSHPPTLLSSLSMELNPCDASSRIEDKPASMSGHTPKASVVPLPTDGDYEVQETMAENQYSTEAADTSKEPEIAVPNVRKSGTGAQVDRLQSTCTTGMRAEFDKQTGVQDTSEGNTNIVHPENRSAVDDAKVLPCQSSCLATIQDSSQSKGDGVGFLNPSSAQLSEKHVSQSSMHSLFSDLLEDEQTASSQVPQLLASQTEKVHGTISPTHVSRHDVKAWKEPSFIAKNKAKRKYAVKEPDTPTARVDKKRQRSAHPETPLPKRARVESPQACLKAASGGTAIGILGDKDRQNTETSTVGRTRQNGKSSSSAASTTNIIVPSFAIQFSRPRMANFSVNFQRIVLGMPTPRMKLHPELQRMLLTTGRIRKCKGVEEDGSVYINQ